MPDHSWKDNNPRTQRLEETADDLFRRIGRRVENA